MIRLLALVATLQFEINAIESFLPKHVVAFLWAVGGALVLVFTIQIENYFRGRRGMGP